MRGRVLFRTWFARLAHDLLGAAARTRFGCFGCLTSSDSRTWFARLSSAGGSWPGESGSGVAPGRAPP